MIITFDPMINSASTTDAAFMNFLRCVTAAATAAAGTSSLTVRPFVNNTGTLDNTKNCIISVDANAEAGGWTTSASHTVVNSGSFTGFTANMKAYLADFYVASGKSAAPYLKLSFSAPYIAGGTSSIAASSGITAVSWNTMGVAPVVMTIGNSTAPNLGADAEYTLNQFVVAATNTSVSLVGGPGTVNSTSGASLAQSMMTGPAMQAHVFKMAITKDYCILWETSKSNSYTAGYSSVINPTIPNSYTHTEWAYGTLMYAGLRETYPWENTLNNNPPWTALQVSHTTKNAGGSTDIVAANMSTVNGTGQASSTPVVYWTNNTYNSLSPIATAASTAIYPQNKTWALNYNNDSSGAFGIDYPLFVLRDSGNITGTPIMNMPVADDTTGSLVPCAVPIVIKRLEPSSWHPGGALRGLYKSLDMPYSLMKLYFSENQTFTINGDPYMPIVFNETMYLVRFK